MRKRIALFANGWVTENLKYYLEGIARTLPSDFADIYSFISYESYGQPENQKKGYSTIFKLPVLSTFDAAIVFYPGLNFADSIDYIYGAIKEAGIPCISLCYPTEGAYNLNIDNYSGMRDLCEHVLDEHKCKDILFIAGTPDSKDSNDRLQALKDALSDRGLNEPEVYYSNWENGSTKTYLESTYSTKQLPDAIICANDHLATFAILAVEAAGHRVPEEVLVTGFDHQQRSQIFYPSIASVDQHYDKLGEATAETLVNIFVNNAAPYETYVSCSFYPAESCGCKSVSNSDILRRAYTHNFPDRDHQLFRLTSHLFNIENTMLYSDNYATLKKSLNNTLANHNDVFSYAAMLDPLLSDIGKDTEFPSYSFSETMDVVVSKNNGKSLPYQTVTRQDIVPGYQDCEGNQIYLLASFFLSDFVCGYLSFANNLDYLDNDIIYDITNRLVRILVSLQHNFQLSELNLKLSELMEQDTLTRVKNRTAYEKYLAKLERDFIEGESPQFAVVYLDINNLKMVNDMYGHEKGDSYIKNSCRLICNTFKHSPVFRIGGDEFVAIIINDDYTNRHELLTEMKEHMATLKAKGEAVPLTERISIASGMAEYDRTLDNDFASIFKRADELMYENKYMMKKDK